ncbi:sensor histidine kinase [Paenibacillus hemerocallicola]|uniref:histidine kinase n=1 Tax=Paenibacillus hemerocallicola TaxID=1172614 RepID=A0A5C4T6S2_9BACL|nr:histidine kinase [Paenibacillus hemerocallicola]TNJ64784.1 sensor histidine kinase [Paenibacillus hemerocallicola]
MSYKQIKWLILIIPTLTIGLWEYVRHQFLLPYISMELGNWLAPVIVFTVTVIFLTQLFSLLEDMQEELKEARAEKAALEEREKMARELHDGIAQSLFLLAVQVDVLDKRNTGAEAEIRTFRQTVHEVNGYVRQAIANLRDPVSPDTLPWMELMKSLSMDLAAETGIRADWSWKLPEEKLSAKEKVELYASLREALLNVRKHAYAEHVRISSEECGSGWICAVSDDGKGFDGDNLRLTDKFGLKIMRERAVEMGWTFELVREHGISVFRIRKRRER